MLAEYKKTQSLLPDVIKFEIQKYPKTSEHLSLITSLWHVHVLRNFSILHVQQEKTP